MNKICEQCGGGFEITEEEADFRNKITSLFETGPVPPPSFCPDCRMQRKMLQRNERALYKRKCDKTGKSIISVYSEDAKFPVYERSAWWEDDWDPFEHGQEFDFGRSFFEQFAEVYSKVPRASLNAKNVENSDYCNFICDSRNCYLSHCSYYSESLINCYWSLHCKDCIDCNYIFQCERCFECVDCNDSFDCKRCTLAHNSSDSYYLYDCKGCVNCFGCVGLRQKEYHLFNKRLSKDEYEKEVGKIDLQNSEHVRNIEEKVREMKLDYPHKYSIQDKCEDCTGGYVFESKNCKLCFQVYRSRDCLYVQDADGGKDCLDGYHAGWFEVLYEVYSPVRQNATGFCMQCWDGNDNFYSDNCHSSSHCFGCVGLRHKKYCILNKQYSKEEYEELLPKIVEHMKGAGEWGEFFPAAISPFAYNETTAQEYYPLSKEEALSSDFGWKDPSPKEYLEQTFVIPDTVQELSESFVKEVLACEDCGKNYRISKQELAFYQKSLISIPRKCLDCRHGIRMKERNPRKLWDRKCDKCGAGVETTFSPESPEKVYCEKCYLGEVY